MVKKIKQFVSDVAKEMKKVTWPTKEQLKESTVVVFGTTFVITTIVYVIDWVFSQVLSILF